MVLSRLRARIAAPALAALLTVAASAQAGTIRHDRADSPYTTRAASYPSVGALAFDYDPTDQSNSGFASGVLITPTWVLTAGHVSSALPGDSLHYFLNGQVIPVVERRTHPEFTGNPAQGYDIGLVRLATPVAGVTPAQRFTGTAEEEFDRTATYVGFGETGTGVTGRVEGTAGTKRAGENVSDIGFTAGGQLHYMGSDFDDPPTGGGYTNDGKNYPGSSTPLNLEYCFAPGDSGGGVFVDFGSGPLLAGVISFVTVDLPFPFGFGQGDGNANASYSDLMASTRVSFFNSFINQTIPEPAALALLLLPAALCGRRRRRRL